MNYYISDLHLGHANIIRLSNRPFKNIDDMESCIIKNWNNKVQDNDDVYILGDIAYRHNIDSLCDILSKLKGKKHLIIGNHDVKTLRNNKVKKYFKSISYYKEIKDGDKYLVLSHYPILEWNGHFHGSIHLHGHIHNDTRNNAYKVLKTMENVYNVGVDIIKYEPCTLNEVIKRNKEWYKD